jgi:hypothetical protein
MNPIHNNKPFSPGHDNRRNMNGRPRSLKTILTGHGLTGTQATDMISELVLLTELELQELANDNTATIFETTIATALLRSKAKGSLYSIETILNRAHGLPKASQDIILQNKTYEVTLDLTP